MTLEMFPRSLLDEYAVNLARLVVRPLTEGDVIPGATKQTERLDEGTQEIEE